MTNADTPNRCEPPEEWRHRGGYHWLLYQTPPTGAPEDELGPSAIGWSSLGGWHLWGDIHSPEAMAERGWRYVAPVLTPDEIAAREAAAYQRGQREMREAALGACRQQMVEYRETAEAMEDRAAFSDEIIGCKACVTAIAAIPIKEKPE